MLSCNFIARLLVLCGLMVCFCWLVTARQPQVNAAVAQSGCENFELSPPLELLPAGIRVDFVRDLNNDGWVDLGLVNTAEATPQLAIWYGENGGLSFRKTPPLMAAQAVTIDDFDGDGYLDLFTPQGLWRNGGERFFPPSVAAPEQSETVATGDFNGDGKADLVTRDVPSSPNLRIRLSNGNGSFFTLLPISWNRSLDGSGTVAVADFNRDGKLDLFLVGVPASVSNVGDRTSFCVMMGDGQGGFTLSQQLEVQPSAVQVAAQDMNGDGHPDLIYHSDHDNAGGTQLRLNDGRGNFPVANITGLRGSWMDGGSRFRLGDFNGDKKIDVLVVRGFYGAATVMLNGQPNFVERTFGLGQMPFLSDLFRDFNRDGRDDLLIGNQVYLSRCTQVPQRKLAVTSSASYATMVVEGSIASIFGPNLATATVTAGTLPLPLELGGVSVSVAQDGIQQFAPLLFVSPTQINFIVPVQARKRSSFPSLSVKAHLANNEISFGEVRWAVAAPGLFSANGDGQGVAAAQVLRVRGTTQTYENIARFDTMTNRFVPVPIDMSRADEEVYLILYGTGLTRGSNTLMAGNTRLPLQYVGPQGSFAGLDQINALLPRSLMGAGLLDVVFLIGVNAPSNTVQIQIK